MFSEDLTAFFNLGEHAVEAIYRPAAGAPAVPVNGIFENGYLEALGMAGSQPEFTCPAAGVPAFSAGDVLEIGDTDYTVVGARGDGTGVTVLQLQLKN